MKIKTIETPPPLQKAAAKNEQVTQVDIYLNHFILLMLSQHGGWVDRQHSPYISSLWI